jgi:hypothetical protein
MYLLGCISVAIEWIFLKYHTFHSRQKDLQCVKDTRLRGTMYLLGLISPAIREIF